MTSIRLAFPDRLLPTANFLSAFHAYRVPRFLRHGAKLRLQYVAKMARMPEHAKYHLAFVGKYELNKQKSLYQQLAPASASESA